MIYSKYNDKNKEFIYESKLDDINVDNPVYQILADVLEMYGNSMIYIAKSMPGSTTNNFKDLCNNSLDKFNDNNYINDLKEIYKINKENNNIEFKDSNIEEDITDMSYLFMLLSLMSENTIDELAQDPDIKPLVDAITEATEDIFGAKMSLSEFISILNKEKILNDNTDKLENLLNEIINGTPKIDEIIDEDDVEEEL